MMTNLYDYELLARQKREAMETEAAQRRAIDAQARPTGAGRRGLAARLGTFLSGTKRAAVATRAA